MIMKVFVVLILIAVVISLFSGLFFMLRDRGAEGKATSPANNKRTVRALTVRIALSLVLFSVLILGYHWGWYAPGGR